MMHGQLAEEISSWPLPSITGSISGENLSQQRAVCRQKEHHATVEIDRSSLRPANDGTPHVLLLRGMVFR